MAVDRENIKHPCDLDGEDGRVAGMQCSALVHAVSRTIHNDVCMYSRPLRQCLAGEQLAGPHVNKRHVHPRARCNKEKILAS